MRSLLQFISLATFFTYTWSSGAHANPCDPSSEFFDPAACISGNLGGLTAPLGDFGAFQEQLEAGLTGAGAPNPFESGSGGGASCADPDGSKAAAGEAYCFEAYFCTAHESSGSDDYDEGKCDAVGGTLIDMTVYVPGREALTNAAQAVAGSSGSSPAALSRSKPRCKGCKVERKGSRRDSKPACRGCKVERSTAAGGVRFELTGAADGVCNVGFSPLLVHSHGFGGAKQGNLDEPGAQISEQAALKLWREKGYSVVSFSERGFGKSGGVIEMMNPLKEGLDTNEVVDWAIRNLREDVAETAVRFAEGLETAEDKSSVIASEDWSQCSILMGDAGRLTAADPDPRLGSTGYSYGGHFQYTATYTPDAVEPGTIPENRWEAINPQGTWMDLRHALAAHDVPKSTWISIMYEFSIQGGNTQAQLRPPPQAITDGFTQASSGGLVDGDLLELFKRHSSVNYCDPENGSTTDVDVFHIQGVADTLFNFNDGYDNALCKKNAGNDVRFLSVLGGHLIPAISPPHHSGEVGMSLDEVVHCGRDASGVPIQLSVRDMIVDWFEEKLRFQEGAADYIPEVCIVQENLDGGVLVSPEYSGPGTLLTSDQAKYASRFAVEGVTSAGPPGLASPDLVELEDIVIGMPADSDHEYMFENVQLITSPALTQSAFVCLYEFDVTEQANEPNGKLVVGIPTLDLSAAQNNDATAATSTLLSTITGEAGVSGGDPQFYVGIGVRRAADGEQSPCRDGDNKPAVTYEIETSSGAADTFIGQLLGESGIGGVLQPLLGTVLEPLLGGPLKIGENRTELLHDQMIAIKGTTEGTKFPYELPLAPVRDADYPWKIWDGTLETANTEVGFGCAPNASAVADVDGNPNSACPDYSDDVYGDFGRMAGVSARLLPGDQVGLYFFGSSLQYVLSSDKVPDVGLQITGKARLPIIDAPAQQPDSLMVGPKAN